ncbi:alkylglycerol monooxygenase [Trichonephila clavipes]|nr:alkylglycerol monooxygenase [Trichonephila clavipes]
MSPIRLRYYIIASYHRKKYRNDCVDWNHCVRTSCKSKDLVKEVLDAAAAVMNLTEIGVNINIAHIIYARAFGDGPCNIEPRHLNWHPLLTSTLHQWEDVAPLLFATVLLEQVVRYYQKKPFWRFSDTMSNAFHGFLMDLSKIPFKGAEVFVYAYIYNNYRLIDLPWNNPWTWIACWFITDFCYYWMHRMIHQVNILWAIHETHHTPEDMMFTSPMRNHIFLLPIHWLTYMPMALAIPPTTYLVHYQISIIYQYWLHTEIIGKLPAPIEYVLSTPSHHRAHHGKQQSLHSSNDAKVYDKITEWVTKFQNQELIQTTNNLKTSNAPIFYHHSCEVGYFNDYKKITVNTVRTSWHNVRDIHKDIFNKIVSVIEEDVVKKRNYLSLTSLCDMYIKELQEELIHQTEADVSLMTNHQLEEKIVKQFKQIKIVIKKKRKIIMHKNSNLLEQEDLKKLEKNDLIDKVAFILRSTILKRNKTTLPAVMKMEDLINGEYTIPEKLDRFFKH